MHFLFSYYRTVGAMTLALTAKMRKMDDLGTTFQDKTVKHSNSLCWQITHHTDEK